MKLPITILITCIFLTTGCNRENSSSQSSTPTIYLAGGIEYPYPFLESIQPQSDYFSHIESIKSYSQYSSSYENTKGCLWLRYADNLNAFYQAAKEVGLNHFLTKDQVHQHFRYISDYDRDTSYKLTLYQFSEKLIETYQDTTGAALYFIEFWQRRETERNAQTVYNILKDAHQFYSDSTYINNSTNEAHPILQQLFEYEAQLKNASTDNISQVIKSYYLYLVEIDLEISAFNLLKRERKNNKLSFNVDSLLSVTLPLDTVSSQEYNIWEEKAKWFQQPYYSSGS